MIVADGLFAGVALLPRPARALGWEQTGTALVVYVSGEPPDPEAGWLLCDLLDAAGCERIGPTLWHKDFNLAPTFVGR